MTIKCEKCSADVELAADAKTGKCEKCGAEVTAKEAAAEEKKEEAAAEEKKEAAEQVPADKAKKLGKLVVEIIIIIAALAFVPRISTRLHQHRMDAQGMPVAPENVKELQQCTNLEIVDVVIPGCFTSIGEGAFQAMNLKNVTIPTTVKSIGKDAFADCAALETVTFKGGAGMYALLDVITLAAFKSGDTPVVIRDGAFERCVSLKSFEIPAGVTEIGTDAFGGCRSLASVVIPDSVTKIGVRGFGSCTALKKITIPDSVKTIEKFAFSGSGLEEISIPKHFTDDVIKTWSLPEKCKITKR